MCAGAFDEDDVTPAAMVVAHSLAGADDMETCQLVEDKVRGALGKGPALRGTIDGGLVHPANSLTGSPATRLCPEQSTGQRIF